MILSSELEQDFYAGNRSAEMPFVINDAVRITGSDHSGRTGAVVSCFIQNEQLVFVIEPGTEPYADMNIDADCLELIGD